MPVPSSALSRRSRQYHAARVFPPPCAGSVVRKGITERLTRVEDGKHVFPNVDLFDLNQLVDVQSVNINETTYGCIEFLERVLFLATSDPPNASNFEPLAARYAKTWPDATYPINPWTAESYKTDDRVRVFVEGAYKPIFEWIGEVNNVNAITLSWPIRLQLMALPARSVPDLKSKLNAVRDRKAVGACTNDSILADPLFSMLCEPTPGEGRANAPTTPDLSLENSAASRAEGWMREPVMQEPLVDIVEWALFMSPLFDFMKPDKTLYSSIPQFL